MARAPSSRRPPEAAQIGLRMRLIPNRLPRRPPAPRVEAPRARREIRNRDVESRHEARPPSGLRPACRLHADHPPRRIDLQVSQSVAGCGRARAGATVEADQSEWSPACRWRFSSLRNDQAADCRGNSGRSRRTSIRDSMSPSLSRRSPGCSQRRRVGSRSRSGGLAAPLQVGRGGVTRGGCGVAPETAGVEPTETGETQTGAASGRSGCGRDR